MTNRAWAIKLGSGGRCVPFCEKHGIVGIGWKDVPASAVTSGSRSELLKRLQNVKGYGGLEARFGQWVGSLNRFGSECQQGDFILYYDPAQKHVRICEVSTSSKYRDFDTSATDTADEEVDVWHFRKVRFACEPIPILDLYGSLKGKLLGPQGTFWQLHEQFELIKQITMGISPGISLAKDSDISRARATLEELIKARTEALNDRDWELLAADYFRAQGAVVDEKKIGGNRSVIDFEAVFQHGEIPPSIWRVQVKRYQNRRVDQDEIRNHADHAGDAHFCFVSVFGFTDEARKYADSAGVRLMQAEDFSSFILGGKLRETLTLKLMLPK
ncbi:MAG: restriction endonuclease [Acidobacteriaceae bacterium]|jgi:predicted Mrr-cat superfamily restriction endonuclease